MIKVEPGCLQSTTGAAFAVVGVGFFEEPGIERNERVKTTMFCIHANDEFTKEYERRVDAYNGAFACDCIPEYQYLEEFRKEVCGLTCSRNADLRQVGHNAFVVTWRRITAG